MGEPEGAFEGERGQWPRYLQGKTPAEIFARLTDSDPLRLREGAARRLRELWFLLEPDRVFSRALAVVAQSIPNEPPPPDHAEWTRSKIDLAIQQLLNADYEAEQTRPGTLTQEEGNFPLLTQVLLRDPNSVRAVTVAFNALDPLPRRAFFELLVEGRDLVECIESGPWDRDGLYDAIQAALATLDLDMSGDREPMPHGEGEAKT